MKNDTTKPDSLQPAAGMAVDLFDNWFDPLESAVRARAREFIEEMIRGELNIVLARPRYGRGQISGDEESAVVTGHRHGSRKRSLTGTFGPIEIAVPRARLNTADGKTTEWKSQALRAYQRRTLAADALIASTYLAGTNTRRVRRALAEKRNNSVATRNARLAAIRSFFHHVAAADPASFGVAQRVLTIPTKRAHIEVTRHLTSAEVDAIVAAPDQTTPRGRRDRTLLLFLARTGARVSEATGVNANDLRLQRPHSQVLLRGKGRRDRVVPIPQELVRSLTALLSERGVAYHEPKPIFVGMHNERLTRFGATHIVRRAASQAASIRPSLKGKPISPHIFRHSLAMKLLRSGVDLLTIQAWLGHAQVATTHRYAAADVEMMRRGLEKAGVSSERSVRFRPNDAVLQLLGSI